jgi:deazaflavin-dependent oxidoreductase (nitroreductase family)
MRDLVTDIALKSLNQAHRAVLALSRGRLLTRAFGMPVVELHTVGRRTGRDHSTMLTAPIVDGERIVLVASKGGDARDPDWYRNLVANPHVVAVMGGVRHVLCARTADARERADLWPKVVAAYRGYGSYQHRTAREIPLVICEPR